MNVVGAGSTAEAVRAYYHVYAAGGRWQGMVAGHLAALDAAGLPWDLRVGIIGTYAQACEVAELLPDGTPWVSWPAGFEQQTLDLVHADLGGDGYDGPVLYAHTKGAAYPTDQTEPWRECMTGRLVRDAKACIDLLDTSDTVGCHWLDPALFPRIGPRPYYAGNFWWATAEHIRRLDCPDRSSRYHAESWITTVRPRNPVSLVAGWPGAGCLSHI